MGRIKDCDITINDKNLSKKHATFSYKNGEWVLQDGFELLSSMNGTYIFLQDDTPIIDGMDLKISEVYFRATLSDL
jgi:pSer/pThr/pTyr-binding forkhead associated (FHA) protein